MRIPRILGHCILGMALGLVPALDPDARAQTEPQPSEAVPPPPPPEGARSATDVELFDFVWGRAGATGEVLEAEAKADRELRAGLVYVGDLTGRAVLGEDGETIGEIERIVRAGDNVLAVIEDGGFLGIGDDTVAVGMERLLVTPDYEIRVRGLTEELIEATPDADLEGAEDLSPDVPLAELTEQRPR